MMIDVDESDIDVPDADLSTSEEASEGGEDDSKEDDQPNEDSSDPLTDRKANYPEWSWDHVRTYVAIRRDEK